MTCQVSLIVILPTTPSEPLRLVQMLPGPKSSNMKSSFKAAAKTVYLLRALQCEESCHADLIHAFWSVALARLKYHLSIPQTAFKALWRNTNQHSLVRILQ